MRFSEGLPYLFAPLRSSSGLTTRSFANKITTTYIQAQMILVSESWPATVGMLCNYGCSSPCLCFDLAASQIDNSNPPGW